MSCWNCVVACALYYGSLMPQSPLILPQALSASWANFIYHSFHWLFKSALRAACKSLLRFLGPSEVVRSGGARIWGRVIK